MPIVRTVSGLRYEFHLETLDEIFSFQPSQSSWYDNNKWEVDKSDYKEGSGSLHYHCYLAFDYNAWAEVGPLGACQAGDRLHIWHKSTTSHTWQLKVMCIGQPGCSQGVLPYYTTTVITKGGSESWTMKTADIPSNIATSGNQYIYPTNIVTSNGSSVDDWIDHLVVSASKIITVTGLNPGQKVELFRASDNTKITEATCAGGATSVTLDVDAEDYPEYMYLKVYATDGTTLIEVTANYIMCGGDTWNWTCPLGTLGIKSSVYTIYRTSSSGTPKSATVTATLLTLAGDPYPGKTIYWWTSKGSVSPSSSTTDSNGQATTTLSGDVQGIAVVKATWNGDASVPPAVAYAVHHILYDLEVGDSSKKFQFFVEGIEYSYSTGSYTVSNETTPREFSVEIPQWDSSITRRGIISIFRRGVKEFSGVLTTIDRTLTDPPHEILSGLDNKSLLDTRVVTIKDYYLQTVQYMFTDILNSFWTGVGVGSLASYPGTLTQTFADESVTSSISRLCDIVGWLYRVNMSNLLDVASSFGSLKPSILFVQGQNLFLNKYKIDDRQVTNSLRMRGNEDLVSTAFDGNSIENDDLGLLEDVVFQKSIGVQATLDIAAVAELSKRAGKNIAIQADLLDQYDAGSWGLDDSVTLTVPEHGLSDVYKVVRIERDMTDPNYAKVDFVNKISLEWSDLYGRLHRELKDLGAKTTI
jgi:hypothetical protein